MKDVEQGKNGGQKKIGVVGLEVGMVDGRSLRRLLDVFGVTCDFDSYTYETKKRILKY